MSSEPATKRIKLELSSPKEPLNRQDVIAFQKEALFRCLNEQRVNVESLRTQYDVSKRQCVDISRKLANLMALVVTLARFLTSFCEDEEEKELCRQVAEGDETVIVQLSDPFMKLLTKFGVRSSHPDVSRKMEELALGLKNLQDANGALSYENKQLTEEVSSLKKFYQGVIHKYDREDSPTVARVFKRALDEVEGPTAEQGDSKANETDQESVSNGTTSVKTEVETPTEKPSNELIERELQITELKSQLESLNATVEELEKFKKSNEEELIKLRQQVSAQQLQETPEIHDRDTLLEKINHLTKENAEISSLNADLLAKFQELSREQEIYTGKVAQEFQTAQDTLKKHNATLEKDLVRIRTTRDELLGKIAILEAETTKSALLTDLQSAINILQDQWNKVDSRLSSEPQPQDALMKELQDMEVAFKELTNITHKKYSEHLNQESVISKLTVEKTKADQKYFAAMRSKDSILVENKNLTKSLTKSNELINQLKDSDKLLQQKIVNLRQQLEVSQTNEKRLIESNKATNLKVMSINGQLSKLKKSLELAKEENHHKIAEVTKVQTQLHDMEADLKSLKIKAANSEAKCQKLQASLLSDGGDNAPLVEELENFRSLVYCSLCSKNWKSMTIKTCGHVFCENCCKERLASRMRKCPTCNKPFSSNDLLSIHL
ncbi:hypothetical protein HG537_0E01910 [Torulaspora globosa]|uniref:E3 ubiquitin protein ligase n=1 Tax=Torulaspora globosa TaxID=48254 RepID=A0A7H9HV01_9SACH|nr:hypothetical protein HG537_0E01910 [Torulaspora sp. CBS 2947]